MTIAETMIERGTYRMYITAMYTLGVLTVSLQDACGNGVTLVSKYCDNTVAKTGFFIGITPVEVNVDMDGTQAVIEIKTHKRSGVKVTPLLW